MYRDRLATPLDAAVYWTEYVIRHHGAPHLSYSGKHLNFFQTYCLDIIAAIIAVLYILKLIFIGFIKFAFRKLFGKSKKQDNTKKRQ